MTDFWPFFPSGRVRGQSLQWGVDVPIPPLVLLLRVSPPSQGDLCQKGRAWLAWWKSAKSKLGQKHHCILTEVWSFSCKLSYPANCFMQSLQNLWPHFVWTGFCNPARHTGHMYFLSRLGSKLASKPPQRTGLLVLADWRLLLLFVDRLELLLLLFCCLLRLLLVAMAMSSGVDVCNYNLQGKSNEWLWG